MEGGRVVNTALPVSRAGAYTPGTDPFPAGETMPNTAEAVPAREAGPKWKPDVVFAAYEAAKAGLPEAEIPGVLGINRDTYFEWKRKRAVFARAVEVGKEARRKALVDAAGAGTTRVWEDALGRLPPGLRKVWRKVARYNAAEKAEKAPHGRKITRELARLGDKVQQQLYVHALFRANFNKTEACRRLNLSWQKVNLWEREDPDFKRLILAVHDAKKDLFESKLVEAVARGDTAAVLFANRTLNRDRGYADKQEVEHTHTHALVKVEDLPLDLETKKKVLEAYRRANAPALPAADASAGVIDAEVLDVLEAADA